MPVLYGIFMYMGVSALRNMHVSDFRRAIRCTRMSFGY